MQPKDGQTESGQLPSTVAVLVKPNVQVTTGLYIDEIPRPAYRNFTNQFLSPDYCFNWFPVVSIDN